MVTKNEARDVEIDWEAIERLTEVRRTYLVKDSDGREFFKMYKPSEANDIFSKRGWHGKLVGILSRDMDSNV